MKGRTNCTSKKAREQVTHSANVDHPASVDKQKNVVDLVNGHLWQNTHQQQ